MLPCLTYDRFREPKKLNPISPLERRIGRASDVRRSFGCLLGLLYPRDATSRPIWHLKAGVWDQEGADAQQKLISKGNNGSGKPAKLVQEQSEADLPGIVRLACVPELRFTEADLGACWHRRWSSGQVWP